MRSNTFKFAVAKPSKSANHNAPRSSCLTHDSHEEIPEFLQCRPSHGNYPSLAAERHVDVNAGRFEEFAAWIDAWCKQPSLVSTEAVRAQENAWVIHWVEQRRTYTAWWRQHKRRTMRNRAVAAIAITGRPYLLGWRRGPKAGQRATGQCQRQRPTATGVNGKTQVFEKMRPAAKWNEVGDCLLWNNL